MYFFLILKQFCFACLSLIEAIKPFNSPSFIAEIAEIKTEQYLLTSMKLRAEQAEH